MTPRFPKGFSHPVRIGSGGFGSVYRARQVALERLVALKLIEEKNLQTRTALKREASLQADLHIPGTPQVYDVQEFSQKICIVMQWVRGCSLRTILQHNPPPDRKHAIATEIIKITSSLHGRGYAHRDIKPENIIISHEGVFLIDFGLSRHIVKDSRQTMADVVKGTPAYIAPELWQGQGPTADLIRADVYSIGKVIQEIFGQETIPECIQKCLIENPDERLTSACDLFVEWEAFAPQKIVNWIDVAEPYASELLASQLLGAAKSLINEHRTEEAYQLLVECLQTDPESRGAFEMMEQFPTIKKRQSCQYAITYVLIGAIAIIICVLSFFLFVGGTRVRVLNSIPEPRTEESPSLKMSTSGTYSHHLDVTLPFKEVPIPIHTIYGRIMIVSHPFNGHFLFDNGPINIGNNGLRVNAPHLEHILSWQSEDKNVVWKELVVALPFEEKRIRIKEW